MLPPPTTTATSTSSSAISFTCSATDLITVGLIPNPCSPAKASPLSFKTTRLYFGFTHNEPPIAYIFILKREHNVFPNLY